MIYLLTSIAALFLISAIFVLVCFAYKEIRDLKK